MRESLTLEERSTNRFRFYIAKSIINREISGTIESASGIQVVDIDFNPENKYVSFIAKLANGEVLNCNSEGFVLLDEPWALITMMGKMVGKKIQTVHCLLKIVFLWMWIVVII